MGIKQFALDNGIMNVQLLASAVQPKHSAFGSLGSFADLEGLWGCCEAPGGMYGGAQLQILEHLNLVNDCGSCAGI